MSREFRWRQRPRRRRQCPSSSAGAHEDVSDASEFVWLTPTPPSGWRANSGAKLFSPFKWETYGPLRALVILIGVLSLSLSRSGTDMGTRGAGVEVNLASSWRLCARKIVPGPQRDVSLSIAFLLAPNLTAKLLKNLLKPNRAPERPNESPAEYQFNELAASAAAKQSCLAACLSGNRRSSFNAFKSATQPSSLSYLSRQIACVSCLRSAIGQPPGSIRNSTGARRLANMELGARPGRRLASCWLAGRPGSRPREVIHARSLMSAVWHAGSPRGWTPTFGPK